MNKHVVLFLNAPKKVGKDVAASVATSNGLGFRHMKMAARLKTMTAAIFNVSLDDVKEWEKSGNNDLKDIPRVQLMGMSWREALIMVSEEWMKPKFGKDIFGKFLADDMSFIPRGVTGTAISDSGFEDEAQPIIRKYKPENCYLIRIHRPDHDFTGDSRSYWSGDGLPRANVIDIHNNFELRVYKLQMLRLFDKIMNITGREYPL